MSSTPGLFYTEQLSSGLRVAQVVGLTTTAFLAGKTLTQSVAATPALLESPAPLLARQWLKLTNNTISDKWLVPAVALFHTGVFGYLAYREPKQSTASYLYTSSASLLGLLVPYTLLIAGPIVQKLDRKAESFSGASLEDTKLEEGIAQEETVHGLVDQWALVNFGGALISGLGAVLATWAVVDKVIVVPAGFKIATGANRLG